MHTWSPFNILTCDIRSHTSGEPTSTMDDHPNPYEYPHLDTIQFTTASSQLDPDDYQKEFGPFDPRQRHLHNSQQRIPMTHYNCGLQALSGGDHTDSLLTPICSGTQIT